MTLPAFEPGLADFILSMRKRRRMADLENQNRLPSGSREVPLRSVS